jgi:hypothetical protein
MKRIVTSTYRYKRPPRKRKAQAVAIPQAVVVKARKPEQRHVERLEEARAALSGAKQYKADHFHTIVA